MSTYDPFDFPGGTASTRGQVPRNPIAQPEPERRTPHLRPRRACHTLGVCLRTDAPCDTWAACARLNTQARQANTELDAAINHDVDTALRAHRRVRLIVTTKRLAAALGVAVVLGLASVGAGTLAFYVSHVLHVSRITP